MTDLKTTAGKIEDLNNRLSESRTPMGAETLEAIHAAGNLSARERIEKLLDEGSFVETDALARHRSTDFGREHDRPYTDGVVTGYGTVDGRKVCIFSQDPTVFDGTLGEAYAESSPRSTTSHSRPVSQSSACMTPPVRASKKASSLWLATPASWHA